ncbi:MAG: cell division protein FtsA [Bacteroidales bacterium]|jgi:cell division protein FtsA|nr:cell division protein FtsA [Bacteroidales bacterium]
MALKNNISVVIDIGTSKIVGLAGHKTEDGKIAISGISKIPSSGIKRGLVFNIDEVAASLIELIHDLQQQTQEEITSAAVTFAGQHIKTEIYSCSRFTSEEGIVTAFDVTELYNEAQNTKIENDYSIIHVIPQCYTIDNDIRELNPVGIAGKKLEAKYKLLVIPEVHLVNLQRVFDQAGITIENITLSPIAIAEATISDDEKEIGAVMLDIGAGTTKLAIYFENILVHIAVIPFGGNVITRDIKEGCSILPKWAEQLKIKYGEALGDLADEQKVVTIPGHNGWEPKEITFKSLAFIIQARLEEIIDNVNYQIGKSGVEDQLGSGIVISGGTANLNNITSMIKFRTGLDARKAFPVILPVNRKKEFQDQELLNAIGMLKLSLEKESVVKNEKRKKKREKEDNKLPYFRKIIQGVLNYIDDDSNDLAMN